MLYTRIFELTILENIKNPDETFGEIWKILRTREKHSEILSLRGGVILSTRLRTFQKPKIIEIHLRSSENGDVEVPRHTGGSLRILPFPLTSTSFGDSYMKAGSERHARGWGSDF